MGIGDIVKKIALPIGLVLALGGCKQHFSNNGQKFTASYNGLRIKFKSDKVIKHKKKIPLKYMSIAEDIQRNVDGKIDFNFFQIYSKIDEFKNIADIVNETWVEFFGQTPEGKVLVLDRKEKSDFVQQYLGNTGDQWHQMVFQTGGFAFAGPKYPVELYVQDESSFDRAILTSFHEIGHLFEDHANPAADTFWELYSTFCEMILPIELYKKNAQIGGPVVKQVIQKIIDHMNDDDPSMAHFDGQVLTLHALKENNGKPHDALDYLLKSDPKDLYDIIDPYYKDLDEDWGLSERRKLILEAFIGISSELMAQNSDLGLKILNFVPERIDVKFADHTYFDWTDMSMDYVVGIIAEEPFNLNKGVSAPKTFVSGETPYIFSLVNGFYNGHHLPFNHYLEEYEEERWLKLKKYMVEGSNNFASLQVDNDLKFIISLMDNIKVSNGAFDTAFTMGFDLEGAYNKHKGSNILEFIENVNELYHEGITSLYPLLPLLHDQNVVDNLERWELFHYKNATDKIYSTLIVENLGGAKSEGQGTIQFQGTSRTFTEDYGEMSVLNRTLDYYAKNYNFPNYKSADFENLKSRFQSLGLDINLSQHHDYFKAGNDYKFFNFDEAKWDSVKDELRQSF